ncbi:hypothetical protein GCM10009564_40420 [Streptomyces thermogriseus]|uniref:Uncharacterized protein n=1 Tax=Streptomyces thermogriseus TaxID=75292 RepID=A0ABN1T2Y7_9ACTN
MADWFDWGGGVRVVICAPWQGCGRRCAPEGDTPFTLTITECLSTACDPGGAVG